MSVSAVSIQEINEARASVPVTPRIVKKLKSNEAKDKIHFIEKFSDKRIAEFFTPYGYITHERSDDAGAILVLCDNCQIIFDDFTVMAEPSISLFTNNTAFDFVEFAAICEQANTTPSQAIADRLEEEVFNEMPYYVEKKRAFTENNLNRIAKDAKYGKLMKAATTKQSHRENFASLNKTYGSSDPEKIADTLARVIPGK